MTSGALALWAGLLIGLAFGATGQITGFCLSRGLRGYWLTGEDGKLRSFALALAVAMFGTQAASAAGIIDLRDSIYLAADFSWLLVPIGAAMFGCGMVIANGCGARALVLLGQGNLRSFVVLVCLGISAYMTLTGLIAPVRSALIGPTNVSIPGGTFSSQTVRLSVGVLLSAALIAFAVSSSSFRKSKRDLLGGMIVGLLVIAGWLATGWLAKDEFDPVPPASLTFVAPIGETIQFVMIATGMQPGFGVAVVAGVLAGSLIAACGSDQFRLAGFQSPRDMLRYMLGGALMGVGGALAMGCSIGQGLTGLSTLAYSSMLGAAGILAGAWLALRGPVAQSLVAPMKPD